MQKDCSLLPPEIGRIILFFDITTFFVTLKFYKFLKLSTIAPSVSSKKSHGFLPGQEHQAFLVIHLSAVNTGP